MSVEVRPAVLADVPLLADLTARSFDESLHPYLTVAQAGAARFLALVVTHPHLHPGRELLVAVSEEAVVGYADLRTSPEGDAFLSYLCVVEEARGRGVATALLDAFRAERSPRSLALDVFTSNGPANALYDRLGFGRGPLSTWVTRPLPAAASVPAPVEAFATQHATHEAYGFSQFRTGDLPVAGGMRAPSTFGRIGETVLKCLTLADFDDDDVLAALRASFPTTTEAFVIVADDSRPASPHRVVVTSERRTLDTRQDATRTRRHGSAA
ncbi:MULTISPECIES: GNAT family N-acetyltransferase [unclassified Frigoribacterium]|uniref:GNAT family N-acetyltransferase n=1 Tax=unclassified Frigoribacterium TaxID=2627005 RepID=UPI0006F4C589|nr:MULTISPECIES: GNAT family N-acetyltransferase [unclassified Frigoribacterium]KQO46741.1 hypothetical protein ASF07_03350 [Frigoribacterium sp. Leaf254]KQT38834.1 hypothetical protein ASG28_03350 [Frigoribacterium sp. Leaf415]